MATRLVADADAPPPPPETFGLPLEVADGLRRLLDQRPPHIARREVWPGIVADSIGLARDGWASKALALGWSAHDVFGTGPDGDRSFDGLAVWLGGRRIVGIAANTARTSGGGLFHRETYLRSSSPRLSPVFLWEFGR